MSDAYAVPKKLIAIYQEFENLYANYPDHANDRDFNNENIEWIMAELFKIAPVPVTQDHSTRTQIELDDCIDIMRGGDHVIEKMLKIPPEYLTCMLPLAILRVVMRDMRINFDHSKTPSFDYFFENWGYIVLNDYIR